MAFGAAILEAVSLSQASSKRSSWQLKCFVPVGPLRYVIQLGGKVDRMWEGIVV